nr:MAG TPA: hypothetical protein [Caudoviricetes sp.]
MNKTNTFLESLSEKVVIGHCKVVFTQILQNIVKLALFSLKFYRI